MNNDGWAKHEMHVLEELRRLNENVTSIFRVLGRVREEVAGLKARVALYGAIAGLVTSAAISIAVALLKG